MAAAYNSTYTTDARNGVFQAIGRDQYNYYGDCESYPLRHQFIQILSTFPGLPQLLSKLEPASMDASKRKRCLEGTRTRVLKSITDWVSDTSVDFGSTDS